MQLVGYERTPNAALILAEAGRIDRVALEPDVELGFDLGGRRCAGDIEGETHRPCERTDTPWCPEHTDIWICARCRGTCLKAEMDCYEPHVVYLAIVAPAHIKVGVTRAERIETRLHEQGADRGAVIHRVANGRIAREIESELSARYPERIPIGAKIDGLTRSIDEQAWAAALANETSTTTIEPSYELSLATQPVPETLAAGRVVGTKGRLLVLEVGHTTYVTDLRQLVGHEVTRTASLPDRQTGLEAFS